MKPTLKNILLFIVVLLYLYLCYYLNKETVSQMNYLEIIGSGIGCVCPLIMICGLIIIINKRA